MNVNDIKVGETFSKDGEKYEKTRDGVVRESDRSRSTAPKGEVILERQILRG